jgi:molybdopterin molybdotransferase
VAQATVRVHQRPVVAILGSGDELAELEEREAILAGRKIASSNSYVMRAMVRAAGAAPLDLGIARDDPADVRERVAGAAAADLLVTSAGMSVGAHDHLRALLESSGSGMRFWRLRSRPGAPVGFGMVHGKPWIGLPGNPVSTAVTFELFVRPAIRKLAGHRRWFRQPIRVRAGERMETPGQLQHFLRVVLDEGDPVPTARLTGPQGSGILSSMVRADALLVVPEDRERVEPGDELPALPLRGERHTEQVPY